MRRRNLAAYGSSKSVRCRAIGTGRRRIGILRQIGLPTLLIVGAAAIWGGPTGAAEPVNGSLAVGPFPEKWVWPISGAERPDPIAYSFGPRRYRSDQRYDFGRGLDLHADQGTEVRAVLDGEVRIAGKNPAYRQPLVQLRHRKPDSADGTAGAGSGRYFYTNYMYLEEAMVKEGDQVKQGAVIGRSGLSPNGYPRLRFELRDGGAGQANAVHPLAALPYPNSRPPEVEIISVKGGSPHSTVEIAVSTEGAEPDFARLELEFAVAGGEPTRVVYDLAEWNRRHSPRDKSADPLDQERLAGVEVDPEYFQASSERYRLSVRFVELPPAANERAIRVTATAVDARGQSAVARRPK